MSLRPPAKNEITLSLSHRDARGNFSIQRAPEDYLRPLVGEGRGEGSCPLRTVFSTQHTEGLEEPKAVLKPSTDRSLSSRSSWPSWWYTGHAKVGTIHEWPLRAIHSF